MKIYLFPAIIALALGYVFFINQRQSPQETFISEVYDTIKTNYWETISDQKLSELFGLALKKKTTNKQEVINSVRGKDREFVVNLAGTVLANLQPVGKSGLYTQKLEEQLKNTVNNVNPEKDLYKDLGIPKNSSIETVKKAFNELPEEKKKNKEIAYAYQTLIDADTKTRYDQNKVEPTIFTKILPGNIAYLQFKKFSPTSLSEFQKGLTSFNTNSLIFDLRGNIGGAIDETAYFLGNLLGANKLAFDFYHQGTSTPFKTVLDQLPVMTKFKKVIVLVDNKTQSSAELMTASFKRFKVGIVVGTPTNGWGTVERVFPIEHQIDKTEKYSVFLVHSLTLRDDNLPIEGRGVEPNVNIKDANWKAKLNSLVNSPQLVSAVKQIISNPD